MSTLADAVLLAAETIRENPERWTHGQYFRNAAGEELFDDEPQRACQACAMGMVLVAAGVLEVAFSLGNDDVLDVALNSVSETSGRSVEEFNDYLATGPDDVADMLERIAGVL